MHNSEDVLTGVELTAEEYTVRQSIIRNKYAVYGPDGGLVLRAKQKLLRVREEFPFVDSRGNTVFRVQARNILDISGDYTLTDEASDTVVAVLEKQFTFFKHVWRVRDPDGDLLATIESGNVLVEALRNVSSLFSLIPHSYTVEDPGGSEIGSIEGHFSFRDTYTIRLGDTGGVPRETLVAACIAIDALEGN